MHEYQYTIILDPDPDEGGYVVTVPALPGCVTQGETLEEAIAMAKDGEYELVVGKPRKKEYPQR